MSWALRTLTGACAALTFAGCSSSDAKAPVILPVRWGDYSPGLQAKIDAMSVAKDCNGMQIVFNQIGATNLAVRNRFGHGNVEILQYIDDKEREASCFGQTGGTTGS